MWAYIVIVFTTRISIIVSARLLVLFSPSSNTDGSLLLFFEKLNISYTIKGFRTESNVVINSNGNIFYFLYSRWNYYLSVALQNHKYINAKHPTSDDYKCTDVRKSEVIIPTQVVFFYWISAVVCTSHECFT